MLAPFQNHCGMLLDPWHNTFPQLSPSYHDPLTYVLKKWEWFLLFLFWKISTCFYIGNHYKQNSWNSIKLTILTTIQLILDISLQIRSNSFLAFPLKLGVVKLSTLNLSLNSRNWTLGMALVRISVVWSSYGMCLTSRFFVTLSPLQNIDPINSICFV